MIWKVVVKLLMVLAIPPFLLIVFIYAIGSLIIDLIAYCRDDSHLSDSETKKRKTDRQNSRLHGCLDLFIGYFKVLLLDW